MSDYLSVQLATIAKEALKQLSLMDELDAINDPKMYVSVLAQRPTESITEYLSFRAHRALHISGIDKVLASDELYVATSKTSETTSDCFCLFGYAILHPPMKIYTSKEIKEMWEYLLKMMSIDAEYEFEAFMEKTIREALMALIDYEKMLKVEMVPVADILISEEGERIHAFLLAEVKERMVQLVGFKEVLVKTNAPEFLLRGNTAQQEDARKKFKALRGMKPRIA